MRSPTKNSARSPAKTTRTPREHPAGDVAIEDSRGGRGSHGQRAAKAQAKERDRGCERAVYGPDPDPRRQVTRLDPFRGADQEAEVEKVEEGTHGKAVGASPGRERERERRLRRARGSARAVTVATGARRLRPDRRGSRTTGGRWIPSSAVRTRPGFPLRAAAPYSARSGWSSSCPRPEPPRSGVRPRAPRSARRVATRSAHGGRTRSRRPRRSVRA